MSSNEKLACFWKWYNFYILSLNHFGFDFGKGFIYSTRAKKFHTRYALSFTMYQNDFQLIVIFFLLIFLPRQWMNWNCVFLWAVLSFSELSSSRASALIASQPGVELQIHTRACSGQVQEKALIIGWLVWLGLRWGWAVTPEEDTQNELLHQKLRLATSMHVRAIFQMNISQPQRKPWRSCYHKQFE